MDHSRAPVLGWRRQMVERGEELLGTAIERAGRISDAIDGMSGLHLMGREVVGPGMAFDLEVSPYPPGVPVLAPGERITQEVVDYLTTGVATGMLLPDAADPSLKTLRVVGE